ncbi:hypothetical protein EVAR_78258_1 [Eumeta japonica]|uniref:Uncharacterized protein n=1 Tax=Eumeta variegata TaxID=151549 RepID=A0A4C1T6I0_EUMVA|nr:hypothetical protein EVAR_78258_1 [Eumeta japonica]
MIPELEETISCHSVPYQWHTKIIAPVQSTLRVFQTAHENLQAKYSRHTLLHFTYICLFDFRLLPTSKVHERQHLAVLGIIVSSENSQSLLLRRSSIAASSMA